MNVTAVVNEFRPPGRPGG